jgi:hypothetical protein
MNHEVLLAKLYFYRIRGESEDWFRPYLTNRRQKFEVKLANTAQNLFPDWGTVKHAVPKGSILGSLLLIIYINDLLPRINSLSKPILFVHDTSVII